LNELALFAGAGGGILGGKLLGWRTVCAVEYDAYAASVLVARQNDGCLEPFPVWDDVRTFDGRPWRGIAEVVSGGFPCTDISAAGKGAGITGKQSGLWSEMARIVGEVRPRFVFVENSPLLVKRGLAVVLGDLAEMGYDARWGIVGAHHVGAPHERQRLWLVGADAESLNGDTWSCLVQGGERPAPKSVGGFSRLAASTRGGQRVSGFNVNPDWNDWLMGWPIGHTDLKPLATDKFQQWLRSHGVCSGGRAMSKEAA